MSDKLLSFVFNRHPCLRFNLPGLCEFSFGQFGLFLVVF